MNKIAPVLLLVLILVTACSTIEEGPAPDLPAGETQQAVDPAGEDISPQPTYAPPALDPVDLQHAGFRASLPSGWSRQDRGTYYRGTFPPDITGIFSDYFPGANTSQSLRGLNDVIFLPLGLPIPSQPSGEHTSLCCTWQLYRLSIDSPALGEAVLDLALAEVGGGTLAFGFTALPDEHPAIYEETFLPILDSVEPMDFTSRDKITRAELFSPDYPDETPVHNSYFTPLGENAPAGHSLAGRLVVPAFEASISLPSETGYPPGWATFPGFSADFFTYQDYLVPVQQGILPGEGAGSAYQIILSPGRIWSEPGDGGYSRAAFPFVLVFPGPSDAYNGLATFLFDGEEVSSFRFQVVQEIAGAGFELWGQSPMEFRPAELADTGQIEEDFAASLEARLPVQSWQDLADRFPEADLDPYTGSAYPLHTSVSGLMLEDTLYLQPCQTRYGPYPYCEYMRQGSYSLSKSLGAALALLRLAEKYGPEVFDLRLVDYVKIGSLHSGWDKVTFADALNQATGVGDAAPERLEPNPILADEDGVDDPKLTRLMQAGSQGGKLSVCASFGNYPWEPGEVARYNSCNTYLLSLAMDGYLKSVEGPQADVWSLLTEEVFRPLGISSLPVQRAINLVDGSPGVPVLAWGMYPTYQEALQIARLIFNGGRLGDEQLLYAAAAAEMVQFAPGIGLPSGEINPYGEGSYHLSIWSVPYQSAEGVLYRIPYMSGWGGNRILFTPNGLICFRFTDSHDYDPLPLIRTSESLRAFPPQ